MLNGGIKGPYRNFTRTSAPVRIDLKLQQQLIGATLFPNARAGQQNYITPGTYTFVVPAGVTSISAMAVGGGGAGDDGNSGDGGGGGGSGASAGYFNNLPVTQGQSVTVVVGAGGAATLAKATKAPDGGASTVTYGTFVMTVPGGIGGNAYSTNPGAVPPSAPSFTNTPVGVTTGGFAGGGGGAGFDGGGGGGGAAGLSGVGGNGSTSTSGYGNFTTGLTPAAGSGGGGGGGASINPGSSTTNNGFSSAGGGVGQNNVTGGGGGGCATYSTSNPPTTGGNGNGLTTSGSKGGDGGWPGGGGGGSFDGNTGLASKGGDGYVRIIWGTDKIFPTNAGDL